MVLGERETLTDENPKQVAQPHNESKRTVSDKLSLIIIVSCPSLFNQWSSLLSLVMFLHILSKQRRVKITHLRQQKP